MTANTVVNQKVFYFFKMTEKYAKKVEKWHIGKKVRFLGLAQFVQSFDGLILKKIIIWYKNVLSKDDKGFK